MFRHIILFSFFQLKETPDPEFKAKVVEGYNDCYEVAGSVPQEILDRNPLTKQFGRHLMFFKCAKVSRKFHIYFSLPPRLL